YMAAFAESKIMKPYVKSIHSGLIILTCDVRVVVTSAEAHLDGMNPLVWVLDRPDLFRAKHGPHTPEEILRTLRLSAKARFTDIGIGIIMGYPVAENGFMRRLAVPDERILDVAKTWEVNDSIRRED